MGDSTTPLTDPEAGRVVELYKAYLADIGTVGTRHTEANKLYVSLLTALFVLLGLTLGKADRMLPESLQQWLSCLPSCSVLPGRSKSGCTPRCTPPSLAFC